MDRRAVLVVTWLAACGGAADGGGDGGAGGPDAVDVPAELSCTPRSGTRLRRLLRTHDDGTSVDVGIHDTVFGGECRFAIATDGAHVCVPRDGVLDATPRWLEPTCTGEMVGETFTEPIPATGVVRLTYDDGDVCTNEPTFFAVGGTITPDPTMTTAYSRTAAGCVAVGYLVTSYVRLGGPADLASATVSFVGGRLQVTQLDGVDGSRFCDAFAPLRDTEADGRACELTVTSDATIRCLPRGGFATALYTDAACSTSIDVVLPSDCQAATGIVRKFEGSGGCVRATIHELGAPAPPTLFQTGFETCQAYTGEAGTLLGGVVAPETFPGLARTYAPLGGRLERGDLAGGGLRIFRSQLRDVDLDVPCAFVSIPPPNGVGEGTLRCLPEASTAAEDSIAQVDVGYADEACSVPRTVASVSSECSTLVPRYARQDTRVFRVGAATTAPFYLLGETCTADESRVHYEVGEELPAETFVSGVLGPE